jgi:hypothetical protein
MTIKRDKADYLGGKGYGFVMTNAIRALCWLTRLPNYQYALCRQAPDTRLEKGKIVQRYRKGIANDSGVQFKTRQWPWSQANKVVVGKEKEYILRLIIMATRQ